MPPGEFRGPALYLYTSGSTDARKRLCCTQGNLYYEALNFVETVGLTAADNVLCTIPLHHSCGTSGTRVTDVERPRRPFRRERYWLAARAAAPHQSTADLLYRLEWQPKPLRGWIDAAVMATG
jgi:hypothetical protein